MSTEDPNEKENNSNINNNGDEHHILEDQLEELLSMGWTILPESCPSPCKKNYLILACNCPLMNSPNGQKYCISCEAWHFDQDRPKKQKFGELVPYYNKPTDLLLKETKLSKKYKRKPFDSVLNYSLIRSLQSKLFSLSSLLDKETDVPKIKDILSSISLCLENIRMAQLLDQRFVKT